MVILEMLGVFALVGAGIGFVVWLIVHLVRFEGARKENILAVTRPYGGRWVDTGWGNCRVDFTIDGVPGQLTWHGGSKHIPPYTRILFQLPFGNRLRVVPTGFFLSLRKVFGAEDLEIGDAMFDPLFEISATSAEFARTILTFEVKRILESRRNTMTLDVNTGGVTVGMRTCVTSPDEFEPFLDSCIAVLRSIRPPQATGVTILNVEAKAGACQTCGSPPDAESPPCIKCGTKMHRDCWRYFGSCATYGCGGISA